MHLVCVCVCCLNGDVSGHVAGDRASQRGIHRYKSKKTSEGKPPVDPSQIAATKVVVTQVKGVVCTPAFIVDYRATRSLCRGSDLVDLFPWTTGRAQRPNSLNRGGAVQKWATTRTVPSPASLTATRAGLMPADAVASALAVLSETGGSRLATLVC